MFYLENANLVNFFLKVIGNTFFSMHSTRKLCGYQPRFSTIDLLSRYHAKLCFTSFWGYSTS